MTARAQAYEPSPFPQWTCKKDQLSCYCGHAVKPKAPGAIITVKGDCLRPLTCGRCHGHAIGVQSESHGTVVFYGCSRPVFDQILSWPEDVKTWVLLEAMNFITREQE